MCRKAKRNSQSLSLLYKVAEAIINEPAHDTTYKKTSVTSKDSGQPVHPPSMSRVLVYPSLDSLEAFKGTCDQRRLWSDCADAQADLSFRESRISLIVDFVVRWHKSYTIMNLLNSVKPWRITKKLIRIEINKPNQEPLKLLNVLVGPDRLECIAQYTQASQRLFIDVYLVVFRTCSHHRTSI